MTTLAVAAFPSACSRPAASAGAAAPVGAGAAVPAPSDTRIGSPGGGTVRSDRARPPAPGPVPDTAWPSVAVSTLRPVRIEQSVAMTPRLTVTVGGLRSMQIQAMAPGDTSGPGVSVVVEVRNSSPTPIDLDGMSVTAEYAAGVPGEPSTSSPYAPLAGTLPGGKIARGTYVFGVPESAVGTVRIEVASDVAAGVAVFRQ